MKILIADDDVLFRRILEIVLSDAGYEVVTTQDGEDTLRLLEAPDGPPLAIVDWMMPRIDGLDVCRRVRASAQSAARYLIVLTARGGSEHTVTGLDAGANDFLVKPVQPQELLARVRVGVRVIELQAELSSRVGELEEALSQIKTLRGLLPICSYCKKIRDDKDYWQQLETYISQRTDAEFSHGVCPDCFEKHIRPELDQLRASKAKADTLPKA